MKAVHEEEEEEEEGKKERKESVDKERSRRIKLTEDVWTVGKLGDLSYAYW